MFHAEKVEVAAAGANQTLRKIVFQTSRDRSLVKNMDPDELAEWIAGAIVDGAGRAIIEHNETRFGAIGKGLNKTRLDDRSFRAGIEAYCSEDETEANVRKLYRSAGFRVDHPWLLANMIGEVALSWLDEPKYKVAHNESADVSGFVSAEIPVEVVASRYMHRKRTALVAKAFPVFGGEGVELQPKDVFAEVVDGLVHAVEACRSNETAIPEADCANVIRLFQDDRTRGLIHSVFDASCDPICDRDRLDRALQDATISVFSPTRGNVDAFNPDAFGLSQDLEGDMRAEMMPGL